MIGKLSGILIEKNPPQVVLDCHGVGYEVDVPMSTFYNLPAVGDKLSLLTHFVVREDAQILYGFASAEERAAFRQLIKISGVGPRMALGVLSGLSVEELAQAISRALAARTQRQNGQRPRCQPDHAHAIASERHPASTDEPGVQRQRSCRGLQTIACRNGCQRWHQAGFESLGALTHDHPNRQLLRRLYPR